MSETKVCKICQAEKSISEYRLMTCKKYRSHHYSSYCFDCEKVYMEKYRLENKEKIKQWRKENNGKNTERMRKYRETEKGKEICREISLKSYYNNIEEIKVRRKSKKYKDVQNANQRRRNQTPNGKIENSIRNRMKNFISKKHKWCKSMVLLGCSVDVCRKWIEDRFLPGMSWENYGHSTWHIDHIQPCSSFDLTNPEQQKLCFHYTNLQPLWATDNLTKQDKIEVFTSEGNFWV